MTDWDEDFSYGLLRGLYERIARDRRVALLGDAEEVLASGEKAAFLRHDVDVSLGRARELAAVEAGWGFRSTYHVMCRSPFYDPASPEGRADLAAIVAGGHEIGLHFFMPAGDAPPDALAAAIEFECRRLEDCAGAPVRSLSFHMPPPSVLRSSLRIGGRINAYGAPLMGWYLSDSQARWREGDPRESLEKPRAGVLQILVHPIWWGAEHVAPPLRLGAFVAEEAARTGRSFDEVAGAMWDHIVFRAKRPG